jgi:hypothetical protein
MRLRTIVSSVLAAVLVTTALVGGSAAPAAAAGGCGWICDGQDPLTFRIYTGPYDSYTCADDAQTVDWANNYDHNWAYLGDVLLRYSPRCQTAWAYTTSYVNIEIERYDPYRLEYSGRSGSDPHAARRTRMVDDAGYISRACLYSDYWGRRCSGWY